MNQFRGITLAMIAAAIAGTFAPQLSHTASAQAPPMPQINIPQLTVQNHVCSAAGGSSPIDGACSATASQSISNTGGVSGAAPSGTSAGISLSQSTGQTTSCTSVGGTSPISGGSCSGTSTQTTTNSGGVANPP
jgi:hypothetical protein